MQYHQTFHIYSIAVCHAPAWWEYELYNTITQLAYTIELARQYHLKTQVTLPADRLWKGPLRSLPTIHAVDL